LDLTAREFEILVQLTGRPNMVFTREKLLEQVWGYSFYGDPRVVDVHVAKLRKKLEKDPSNPRYLKTVRGIGYKLDTGE
jgi:two-component system alkaline phosphatase synthesis response regulator PhoP